MEDISYNFFKIENNEPCPCGSGKKYSSCCKGKLNKKTLEYNNNFLSNIGRMYNLLYKQYKNTNFKECFYPDKTNCIMPIKNSHTLQNNGVLSLLAEDSNVYVVNYFNQVRNKSIFKLTSKNKSTTFYGFCHYHDDKVFEEIEKSPYSQTKKQNFLFAYRACAQEYHKKRRLIYAIQNSIKRNPSILTEKNFIELYRMKNLDFNDVKKSLKIFNQAILRNSYDILENTVITYPKQVQFAITTMFEPAIDLNGVQINNNFSVKDERLKCVFLSIFSLNTSSIILISYFKEDSTALENYINQINSLTLDKLKIFLNNVIPTFSENIVISPKLWESFTSYSKKIFEQTIQGEFGQYSNLKELFDPTRFSSYEEIQASLKLQTGTNNLLEKPPYDLFKL